MNSMQEQISSQLEELQIEWNADRAKAELKFYADAVCETLQTAVSKRNYLVKYFQQDVFYAVEKELWKSSPELREKLIANRMKYLGVDQSSLTVEKMLLGFKIAALHHGYSHFNPLWFKWFTLKYGVKVCYDPCGGWGHRMLGSNALDMYIYNDLSKPTKLNVDRMARELGLANVETHCEDARTFVPDKDFDAMFTCPPYFNLEKYPCGDFKDRSDYDGFVSSLFKVFESRQSCHVFGIVTREDLMPRTDYCERFQLNACSSHLSRKKRLNEYLYVFTKGNNKNEEPRSMRETGDNQDDPAQLREVGEDKGQGAVLEKDDNLRRRVSGKAPVRTVDRRERPEPVKWNDEYDKQIRDLVERFPKNFARMITSKGFRGRYEDRSSLAEYIDSVTPLLADPFYTLKTKVYWVLHRLEDFPTCEICGKPITDWNVKKLKDPYRRFCCRDCQYKSEATQDKIRSTCMDRYGVVSVFQRRDVKDKIASKQDEMIRKRGQTKFARFGNSGFNNAEKAKKTRVEKYGSVWNLQKCKETWSAKYGADNPNKISKDATEEQTRNRENVKSKRLSALRANGTFNTSTPEKTCYEKLLGKFKDVKRQYKSKDYPFACDFYIPEIDTYVEYQGSWTHGGHPFDANSASDQEQLERWKAKSTKYYDIAINTWTVRDVRKRETAATNKLNFVELWNMEDFDRWLSEVSSR